YYLIQNDMTGRLLMRNLRDAALRGVRVRLLVDDLYTTGGDEMFRTFAAFENVEVRLFNPFCCGRQSLTSKYVASLGDFGRLNHRMHNKLFIADGAMVVAGGRNIDRIVDEGEQMMAVNLPPIDILGYGPIREDLDAGRLGLVWGNATAFADSPEKVTATSDEMARSMSVSMNVMDLIWKSHEDVVISSPYFIPGDMGVLAFGDLRKRGVKITILTNSLASNDEPVVHTGYSRYRVALLKTGVDL